MVFSLFPQDAFPQDAAPAIPFVRFSFSALFSSIDKGNLPDWGISLRAAGDMRYPPGAGNEDCRARLFRGLGIDPARVFACTQVHSQEVLIVDRHTPRAAPEADGLLSRDPDTVLSITVADCLPVLLYDPASGGFGAVHSGWRGTGIALRALNRMEREWRTRPEAVFAILGPCIQSYSYRVDEARAELFEKNFGGNGSIEKTLGPVVCRDAAGVYLNLPAANARLLVDAGVPESHIAVCVNCTATDPRLGSFRREGPNYTRMAILLGFF